MSRSDFSLTSELAVKPEMLIRSEGGGVRKVKVEEEERQKSPALTDEQVLTISKLLVSLEEEMGKPQDFEWAIEGGKARVRARRLGLEESRARG